MMMRLRVFSFFVLILIASPVLAQDTSGSSSTSNPALQRLQAQIDQLTLQAKIADLQAQIQKDKTVTPTVNQVQPLAGKTTADDKSFMEAYTLSYNAMRGTALNIYDRVSSVLPASGPTLVIFDSASFSTISQYRAFRPQLSFLRDGFCRALNPPAAPGRIGAPIAPILGAQDAVTAATNLVGSVATLISLFRTDTNITGTDVAIDDMTLTEEVGNLFKSVHTHANNLPGVSSSHVLLPAVYFPPDLVPTADLQAVLNGATGGCGQPEPDKIVISFAALTLLRVQAGTLYDDDTKKIGKLTDDNTKIDAAKKTQADLKSKVDGNTASTAEKKTYDDAVAAERAATGDIATNVGDAQKIAQMKSEMPVLKSLTDQFDQIAKALGTPDNNGVTPFARYVLSERLSATLNQPDSYVLVIKVVKSSGGNLTKTNLFYGSHLYFTGGSTASFMLLNANTSELMSAGSFTVITNYMREKTFKKTFGSNQIYK
jgi:hypothetical protein